MVDVIAAQVWGDGSFNSPQIDNTRPVEITSSDDSELLEVYNNLRNRVFNDYLWALREDDKYYQKKFGSDVIPKEWQNRGFKPTIPPTAYNAVHAAADHILTTPDIFVPERPTEGDFQREQIVASLKAQALEYFWAEVAKMGDPLGHGRTDFLRDGKIILKKEVRFDILEGGGLLAGRFPWRVTLLHNATVFEDPNNPYDPEYVFEAYHMRVDTAKKLFDESRGKWREKKDSELIEVLEYWEKPNGRSKGRRVMWVDSERVLNKPNPYYWPCKVNDNGDEEYDGYIPYFIADTGWGDGSKGTPPDRRYVGIIRHIHSLVETEVRQLTAADAQLRIGTFPVVMLEGISEDSEKPLTIGPGAKIHIEDPQTQKIEILTWPNLDPALFAMISRVHQYTNELAKFEALGGLPQRGVDTATEAQQNFMNASSKLQGPVGGLQSLIERMSSSVLYDIAYVIEEPVSLLGVADDMPGSITLDPEDIGSSCAVMAELKTSDQAALNRANLMAWANAFQVFGLDKEYAMKMAGIKNPKQRRARRWIENVEDDPRLHELRFAEYVSGRGPLGKMLSEAIVAQIAAGGAPASNTEGMAGQQGGFPPMPGMETNRSPSENPQGAAGQNIRATAFGQALDERPDLESQ